MHVCVDANADLYAPSGLQAQEAHLRPDTRQDEEVLNGLRHVSVEFVAEYLARPADVVGLSPPEPHFVDASLDFGIGRP